VREHLRDRLDATRDDEWRLEEQVAGTPVDVVGRDGDRLTLVELEWRRADPADDAAKLFRHLSEDAEAVDAAEEVRVGQVFTAYYDLAAGGHSSKRLNTEFVGRAAADSLSRVEYRDPPKRGGEIPDGWQAAVETAAEQVVRPSE